MRNKRLKRRLAFVALGVVGSIGLTILALYATPLSYFYCLAREGAWLGSKNREQLETRLFAFYTKKDIDPSESMWGNGHVLEDGQHMTQYLIFSKEPLDVVFRHDGSIDTIYTSYE